MADLVVGTLLRRYKRFLADVELPPPLGVVTAHVANTGSMRSTNTPGMPVAVSDHRHNPRRKLPWTLELVQDRGTWVGVNTARTNDVVVQAITGGAVPELAGWDRIRREVTVADSRLDMVLDYEGDRRCFIEVKNVTYREGDLALFPDAVTARGTKHLAALAALAQQGHRSVLFFCVNRDDCDAVAPAAAIDPTYARALRDAAQAGVEILAYGFANSLSGAAVRGRLPVLLAP